MIFYFLLVQEQIMYFIKLINPSWNTMPSTHGILATHSIWNFLMLSLDFFATLPLVDFSSYRVGQIENQIDW